MKDFLPESWAENVVHCTRKCIVAGSRSHFMKSIASLPFLNQSRPHQFLIVIFSPIIGFTLFNITILFSVTIFYNKNVSQKLLFTSWKYPADNHLLRLALPSLANKPVSCYLFLSIISLYHFYWPKKAIF